MSNGRVIAGKHTSCGVTSDGKGAFIDLNLIEHLNIDRTTAKSVELKGTDPNKMMEGTSFLRVVWYVILIISMLAGLSFMATVIGAIIGLPLFVIALIFFIVSLTRKRNVGAYQVEIFWNNDEKSLIECDSDTYNRIQRAFYS